MLFLQVWYAAHDIDGFLTFSSPSDEMESDCPLLSSTVYPPVLHHWMKEKAISWAELEAVSQMVVYGSLPIPITLTNWVAYCTCSSDGICVLRHTRYCSLASNTGCMTLRQPMRKMPHRMLQPCWGIVRRIRIPWLQMGLGSCILTHITTSQVNY